MSGFIHGGSALTLDIGVRNGTGAVATRGQVVQLDLATAGPPAATGFTAIIPPLAAVLMGGLVTPWMPALAFSLSPGLLLPR